MPYANIEDRRKSWKRYYEKNKNWLNTRYNKEGKLKTATLLIALCYLFGAKQHELADIFGIKQQSIHNRVQTAFRRVPQLKNIKRQTTRETIKLVFVGGTSDLEYIAGKKTFQGLRKQTCYDQEDRRIYG